MRFLAIVTLLALSVGGCEGVRGWPTIRRRASAATRFPFLLPLLPKRSRATSSPPLGASSGRPRARTFLCERIQCAPEPNHKEP
jgi:hypothetical protein